MDNFARCIPIEMAYEGGYSNDAHDPGGVTLNGIIQRVDDAWRRNHGQQPRQLTRAMLGTTEWNAERDAILRAQYWNACRCDQLPAGVDLVVFDGALNSGPYQSALWLQRALGMTDIDGHIGEATIEAAQNHPDKNALIAAVIGRRLGMLHHLSTWQYFGKGWERRCLNVQSIGQHWAADAVGYVRFGAIEPAAEPVALMGGNAKAYASDVDEPQFSAQQGLGTAGSGGGIAVLLQTAKEQLQPYAYSSRWIMQVVMALTLLCVAVAIGGTIYTWHAQRKSNRARAAINGEIALPLDEGGAPLPQISGA